MHELETTQKERLDRFLVRNFEDHSRTKLVKCIQDGHVLIDGNVVTKSGFELKPGQVVTLVQLPETLVHDLYPVPMDLDIVFEDEHLLVINKPRGLTVHPAKGETKPTLVHGLLDHSSNLSLVAGDFRPGIVHRLDKDTTGLLVVAKSDDVHRKLAEMIQLRTIDRRYLAVVFGKFESERVTLQGDIGRHPGLPMLMAVVKNGRHAVTHVRQLATRLDHSLVACKLDTGRTHQIRVHLATFGHPVKGDRLYSEGHWADGAMQLHAVSLCFDHPVTGQRIDGFAPLPHDFEEWTFNIDEVRNWN